MNAYRIFGVRCSEKDALFLDPKDVGVTKDDAQDRALWRRRTQLALRMRNSSVKETKKKEVV